MRAHLFVLLAGCTPEARPFIEVAPPIASAPLVVASASAAPSSSAHGPDCSKTIRVADVDPETPTCTVYGLAAGVEGLLEMPCQGSGPAMARFGADKTFVGQSNNGNVRLEREWSEPIGDGCEWRFTETITGSGQRLSLVYRERITQVTGKCYRPCGAIGEIEVH